MAELARLRDENRALQAEVDALRARLAQYEGDAAKGASVGDALQRMHAECPMQSSSDWIALYWVLTTLAKAPATFTAFAEWVAAYASSLGLPECKPSLLYKTDAIYLKPLYRWEMGAQQSSTLRRRLAMARCLKSLLS